MLRAVDQAFNKLLPIQNPAERLVDLDDAIKALQFRKYMLEKRRKLTRPECINILLNRGVVTTGKTSECSNEFDHDEPIDIMTKP